MCQINFVDDTRYLEKLHKTWVRDTRQDTRHWGQDTRQDTRHEIVSRDETRRDICLETLQHWYQINDENK